MAFVVVQGLYVCVSVMCMLFKGVVASLRVQFYSRPDPGVTLTMFLLIYFFFLSISCNYYMKPTTQMDETLIYDSLLFSKFH